MSTIEAIPTEYSGVRFKSRLEARFAEWLTDSGVDWNYEPGIMPGTESYSPDFYLPAYGRQGLFIEIKPEALEHELRMFLSDISKSASPWICVDSRDRGEWRILKANYELLPKIVEFVLPCRFRIKQIRDDAGLICFPKFVVITGI